MLHICQCSKLNQKSCQSCCLESQIMNIKLKKSFKKVPGPPPKLPASGWRTGSNLEHCICISESGQHWFRQCLVTYSAPSHYQNQCWIIVNWTFQWKFSQNAQLFIHENTFEYIVCTVVAIWSVLQIIWFFILILYPYCTKNVSNLSNNMMLHKQV